MNAGDLGILATNSWPSGTPQSQLHVPQLPGFEGLGSLRQPCTYFCKQEAQDRVLLSAGEGPYITERSSSKLALEVSFLFRDCEIVLHHQVY